MRLRSLFLPLMLALGLPAVPLSAAGQDPARALRYASQDDPKLGRKANPEHASNSPTWALDNWIYSANHTWRYRWTPGGTNAWVKEPTQFRGQWGLSQDNQGRLYHNSNSDQLRADGFGQAQRGPPSRRSRAR